MVRRWLGYGVLLLAGGIFFLFSPGYLSFFLLLVLLLLPLLSLLTALPGLRGLELRLTTGAGEVPRGGSVSLALQAVSSRPFFALPRFQLELRNLLHPGMEDRSLRDFLPDDKPFSLPIPTSCCGWVQCTVTRVWLEDWMGLFRIPLRRRWSAAVLVRPTECTDALPDLSKDAVGLPLLPRPGGGPGEEYELREYRPGDPVNAIHWKLTAKRPEETAPVLRETLEPLREALVVCYDHFGPPETVDRALGRLAGLAAHLMERERPFTLRWVDPFTGAVTHYTITSAADWTQCLRQLCRQPAPLCSTAVSTPFTAHGPVRLLYLDGQETEDTP